MANVGSGANGNTYIGTGNGKSGTYVPIGTFSGLTDHGVVIAQGNGAFVASTAGTAGQILTSNGASADPTFQAAAAGSGSWILIQSQNASSSSALTFTSGITSTYNNFILVISNMVMSTTAFIYVQLSSDGGATYKSSSYLSGDNFFNYNSATNNNNNGTAGFIVGDASDNTYFSSSTNWLNNMTSGTNEVTHFGDGTSCKSTTVRRHYMGGTYTGSALTVDATQVIGSSGTITSGTASLYGLLE